MIGIIVIHSGFVTLRDLVGYCFGQTANFWLHICYIFQIFSRYST